MPQKTFLNSNSEKSTMGTFLKVLLFIALLGGSFGGGYYTANKGYRVVDSGGSSLVKSNAAQTVKDENSRIARDVIGKTDSEAKTYVESQNRTFFVGLLDGKKVENTGQKVFTNLTVEVKDGKVVKVLGWY